MGGDHCIRGRVFDLFRKKKRWITAFTQAAQTSCYRDPVEGDSRIVRLADIKRLPDLLAQGSLGLLVTSNKLDTFLKAPMPEEERRKIGLAWPVRLTRERERLPSGHFRPCGNIACARL